jgi:hypothetical protein
MRIASKRTCACGRDYNAETWAALPLSARLTAEQVSSHVSPWQPDLVVEVRVCAGCKRQVARLCDRAIPATAEQDRAIAA